MDVKMIDHRTTGKRGKSNRFYYIVAAGIAAAAIALGAWFLIGMNSKQVIQTIAKPATSDQSKTNQPVDRGIVATNEDMEKLSDEAEQDLAEMESILAEVDKIDVSQDNDLNDLNL